MLNSFLGSFYQGCMPNGNQMGGSQSTAIVITGTALIFTGFCLNTSSDASVFSQSIVCNLEKGTFS